VLRNADIGTYKEKSGRDQYRFFDPLMEADQT
jgi:hypothetical protein